MMRSPEIQGHSGGFLTRMGVVALAAAATIGLSAGMASAAGTVQWNNPADGAVFQVGTEVMPDGTASGFGTGGTGLDLMLVLDRSGSMGGFTSGQTLLQWQKDAANALVNALPSTNVSVGIVEYGSSAAVTLGLTSTADKTPITTAINAVPAGGLTAMGPGIQAATGELLGPNATDGRSKQMVVISDGFPNVGTDPVIATNEAIAAGIDRVHTVALPGGSTVVMQNIATAGNGIFANFTDPDDLSGIEAFFSGAAGSFVGVVQVDITMPDGSVLTDVAVDAFGNFKTPGWNIVLGANVFQVTAFFEDQTQALATLTLFGVDDTTAPVPLPAAGWLLLAGLAGLGVARRARRKS